MGTGSVEASGDQAIPQSGSSMLEEAFEEDNSNVKHPEDKLISVKHHHVTSNNCYAQSANRVCDSESLEKEKQMEDRVQPGDLSHHAGSLPQDDSRSS